MNEMLKGIQPVDVEFAQASRFYTDISGEEILIFIANWTKEIWLLVSYSWSENYLFNHVDFCQWQVITIVNNNIPLFNLSGKFKTGDLVKLIKYYSQFQTH